MKLFRVLASLAVFALLASVVLTAVPVQAKGGEGNGAQLAVDNRTGGSLYIKLEGPKTYYFNTDKQGRAVFKDIEPGKYSITVTSSGCPGSLSYQKNISGVFTLKGFKCVAQTLGTTDQKAATLTVDNRTGGTLYVTLTGPKTYYFSTSDSGKVTFKDIFPGKYTIKIRSSSCSGELSYTRKVEDRTNLDQFYCGGK